ncbi:hypothetical protein BAL199_22727 [alpha proteobacterium BAL199]|nr:hypothetical protein BAL199_22727 [alpha proteobacterium BAL199]
MRAAAQTGGGVAFGQSVEFDRPELRSYTVPMIRSSRCGSS